MDYKIEAINQEYFTEDYFHRRNEGRAEREILKTKKISVIGCGALGSEVADCLNKGGVGNIVLIDKEILNAQNIVRHVLGIDYVSIPKVNGLLQYLYFHNPFNDVQIKGNDILKANINEYLPEEYIGLSTIADDNIEAYLNECAISDDKIIYYCRALRGGKVARIFRVIPHVDACKACLSIYLMEKKDPFIAIEEDPTLPIITNECNNPIRPASAADLKIIAAIFSQIIIEHLQKGEHTDVNHWIWTTESLDKLPLPISSSGFVYSQKILPHPNCPICQKLADKQIYIQESVFTFIKNESSSSGVVETGGILIGYKTMDGKYYIKRATGPGAKSVRTENIFKKDVEYCQKELEKASIELGIEGLYIGEWHYHPRGSNEPSGRDLKSLTDIACQDNYFIDKPIMIITSPEYEFGITIHDKSGKCSRLSLNIVQ